MRSKQVIQQEIEALQKELETAPEDFANMPDGLYIAKYSHAHNDPRFILKANGTAVSFTDSGTMAADSLDAVRENLDDGDYRDLKLLQAINSPILAPIDLSGINWELIDRFDGYSMAVLDIESNKTLNAYLGELRKIANRVRAKQEPG